MDNLEHGNPLDGPDDHASLVMVIVWMFSAVATLCVIVRFWTKWSLTRTWTIDDTLISIAWGFSIAQGVLMTLASNYGYGELLSNNTVDMIREQEKFVYASNLLFILSMCFSMLSTVRLISSLSPKKLHQQISMSLTGLTALWGLVAFFGFAFQCDLPEVWDFVHGKCINQPAFYTFIAMFNMVIEFGLILLPAVVVWNLQLTFRKKIIVILCFCGRSTVVIGLIAQVVVIWTSSQGQKTILFWAFAICATLIENFSIMAASIPYLKPFMESLETGFMGHGDIQRKARIESAYGKRSNLSGTAPHMSGTASKRHTIPDARWKFSEIEGMQETHQASARSLSSSRMPLRSGMANGSSEEDMEIVAMENVPKGITQTVEYSVASEPRPVRNR